MKTEFSLRYGEKALAFSAEKNAIYELDQDVTVEVVSKNIPEFNASYWTVYFENKSDKDSEIISDIWD